MVCYQEASPLDFLEGVLVASYSASGTRHLMDTEGHRLSGTIWEWAIPVHAIIHQGATALGTRSSSDT